MFQSSFVDTSTLQDLEVVPTPGRRGPTLWSLVNRTRTHAGAQALRRRLVDPSPSADRIVALQQAHRDLAADDVWRLLLDRAKLDDVEKYSSVTWQLPDTMPTLARFRRWYRQYEADVARGQRSVAGMLAAAVDLANRLLAAEASVLQGLGEELAALLDDPAAREVRVLAARPGLRAFDQIARGRTSVLPAVVQFLATVEAMWSLGAATAEHGWSYPQPSGRLRAVGLFHPFLGAGAVPNDLLLNDTTRVCFVTGPNMAGKSTFLKAVSIALLLAHAGCGVPAQSLAFPVVSAVFSSIDIRDNLGAGESFYLAEVRRIAALATVLHQQRTAVAVIDEPFRGTNVHDAAEATLAVMARLADHPSALVFVASHLGEIVPSLADHPGVALFHFEAEVTADVPHFDYRLRDGVSSQRLGMTLLRQERVLELLDPEPTTATPPGDDTVEETART
jgi:DNA mismatch repair protein MutS